MQDREWSGSDDDGIWPRRYGRSGGRPSPAKLRADGLALARHLKERRGVRAIGAHGESIGGTVATHLASKCEDVTLLVADRTFSTLPDAAQHAVGGWAARSLRLLVPWWRSDNVGPAAEADSERCYKLLCQDPNDAIVPPSAHHGMPHPATFKLHMMRGISNAIPTFALAAFVG